MPEINTGDTAWLLISSALVLLMTPGLAFFYGGMVRSKSVLNMMMMSLIAMGIVPILWVLFGYSVAFGPDVAGLIGDLSKAGLAGVTSASVVGTVPEFAFLTFQLMFAVITVALISGSIADRTKFSSWALFATLWSALVYFPVAHWVWGGGWIFKLGAVDFAGGTAVHINAGAAALALTLVLGRRVGWKRDPMKPHNMPFVVLGAGLLWFGWYGFNAGSALAANGTASIVFFNTTIATSAAMLGWLLVETIRDKHATTLGAASGAVAGLVAITPACAAISPAAAIVLGFVAGILCSLAVGLKFRFGYDDSLDVVGVHLVGGLVGSLSIGILASKAYLGTDGLLTGGGFGLLGKQAIGSFAVLAYSFAVAWLLGTVIDKTIGFRVTRDDEIAGVDLAIHAETAYELGSTGGRPLVRTRPLYAPDQPLTPAAHTERTHA